MAGEPTTPNDPNSEDSFFARERAPSEIRNRPQPPSMAKRVALIVVAVAILGAILWFSRSGDVATLWVVNPGPGPVTVEVGGERTELEPGKMLDMRLPAGVDREVKVKRGKTQLDPFTVDLKPDGEEVAIIDLGGEDAAYVVVDASPTYKEGGAGSEQMPIIKVSKPHSIHYLPYPGTRLVRPGRPLPDKNSWELKAARGSGGTLELFKVFRVDSKRLADPAKLTAVLNQALRAKDASQYENMSVTSTSVKMLDGVIPDQR